MKKTILIVLLLLLTTSLAFAQSDTDKDIWDEILEPLTKIYDFIKYSASVVGLLMFAYAGITYLTSGGEQAKKEKAKQIATGVVIGLILIWIAPLVVGYLVE